MTVDERRSTRAAGRCRRTGRPSRTAGTSAACCAPTASPASTPPSGKIEVYNETLKSWGLDPLPFYTEPPQSAASTPELFKKYPLVMITGARSQLYFHAEHRMIPWLREKMPDPFVEIHPGHRQEVRHLRRRVGLPRERHGPRQAQGEDHPQGEAAPRAHHARLVAAGDWTARSRACSACWDYQINKIIPGPQCAKSGFGGGQYKTTLCTLSEDPARG